MNTATMIKLLHEADPSGLKVVLLDEPETDGFQECGTVRIGRLALDKDDAYAFPWDAKSELAAKEYVTLLT